MKTIKSSVKTKPDPLYYKRKADQWSEKRNAMFAEVERLEAEAGGETHESKALHFKAEQLAAKVRWAYFCIPVASRMRDHL